MPEKHGRERFWEKLSNLENNRAGRNSVNKSMSLDKHEELEKEKLQSVRTKKAAKNHLSQER